MVEAAAQTTEQLHACFKRVQELCDQRGLRVTRFPNAPEHALRLQFIGVQRDWTLDVDCSWHQTTKLPAVHLREPLELLAHVGHSGLVCVNDSEGLSVDRDRPADVIAHTALLAFDVLEHAALDARTERRELLNELEGYWSGLPRVAFARCAVDVDETDRIVAAYVDMNRQRQMWYFAEQSGPVPLEFRVGRLAKLRAIYVALNRCVLPPKPGEDLLPSYVEAVLATFTSTQRALWQRLTAGTSKRQRRRFAMLLSVPRANGGRSLVGLSFFTQAAKVHAASAVTPLIAFRHTAAYMRERGGATFGMAEKHVAILGCGSVGSEVADALASSGVGLLTLVDPDLMSEDNVFRHALGREWIEFPKVIALREELMRKYPGLRVSAVIGNAQEWLAHAQLESVDGVAVALGLPTLEREIARQLRAAAKAIPIVFSWLEPLDLGGHSILFSGSGEGCLDCIYRDDEGGEALSPRTSFLQAGQGVTRNLTGCSSIFISYGAVQSRRTALLATEQMLHGLLGESTPRYAFWRGDGTAAAEQGLQTTHWWARAKTIAPLEATKMLFGQPCRRCRVSR